MAAATPTHASGVFRAQTAPVPSSALGFNKTWARMAANPQPLLHRQRRVFWLLGVGVILAFAFGRFSSTGVEEQAPERPRESPQHLYVKQDPSDRAQDVIFMAKEAVGQAAADTRMWLSDAPNKLDRLREQGMQSKKEARMWLAEAGDRTGVTPAAQELLYSAGTLAQGASERLGPVARDLADQAHAIGGTVFSEAGRVAQEASMHLGPIADEFVDRAQAAGKVVLDETGRVAQDAAERLGPVAGWVSDELAHHGNEIGATLSAFFAGLGDRVKDELEHHGYEIGAALSAFFAGLAAWARTHPTQIAAAVARLAPAASGFPGLEVLGSILAAVSMYLTASSLHEHDAKPTVVPAPGDVAAASQESAGVSSGGSLSMGTFVAVAAVLAVCVALAVRALKRRAGSAPASVPAVAPTASRDLEVAAVGLQGNASRPLFSNGQAQRVETRSPTNIKPARASTAFLQRHVHCFGAPPPSVRV